MSSTNSTVSSLNSKITSLTSEVNSLKSSVSEGKSLIASALTDKGISTSSTATFQTMANNITSLSIVDSLYTDIVSGLSYDSECKGPTAYVPIAMGATVDSGDIGFSCNGGKYIFTTRDDYVVRTSIITWYNSNSVMPHTLHVEITATTYNNTTKTVTLSFDVNFSYKPNVTYTPVYTLKLVNFSIATGVWKGTFTLTITDVYDNYGTHHAISPSPFSCTFTTSVSSLSRIPIRYSGSIIDYSTWVNDPSLTLIMK